MRKKDKKNLFIVGAFISVLTIVLMILIVSIGKENSIFDNKVDIRARVMNVSNLRPGSYVELKGIRVGTVSNIQILTEDEVEITLEVLEKEIRWIKQDSKISISTAGLVGDKFIEIYNGSKEAPVIDPEKDILYSENLSDFKKLLSKGESIAVVAERVLSKLDTILYNMNEGKQLIETLSSMNKTSSNLEKITEDLKNAQLGNLARNVNTSMTKLDKAISSMERIMSRVENGPGTMNSVIFDDGLHDDLRALLGGAQRNKVIKYFIRQSIQNSERKKSQAD